MNHSEFQKLYEEEGQTIFNKLVQLSEEDLLALVKEKKWDSNFQIWNALSTVGSKKSIPVLFDIVKNLKNEYLVRYHACNALFKLSNITNDIFKGEVQYGLGKDGQKIDQVKSIEQLGKILNI